MVKTTIDIPDEKWKKFSIKVIEEYGGRKKNEVIEELIDKYLREGEKNKK
jgi:metal-responsive CopG/Arc/MetJ family transcriptional regulator